MLALGHPAESHVAYVAYVPDYLKDTKQLRVLRQQHSISVKLRAGPMFGITVVGKHGPSLSRECIDQRSWIHGLWYDSNYIPEIIDDL